MCIIDYKKKKNITFSQNTTSNKIYTKMNTSTTTLITLPLSGYTHMWDVFWTKSVMAFCQHEWWLWLGFYYPTPLPVCVLCFADGAAHVGWCYGSLLTTSKIRGGTSGWMSWISSTCLVYSSFMDLSSVRHATILGNSRLGVEFIN